MSDFSSSEIPNSSDCIRRQAAIEAAHKNYDTILDFKSDGRTVADSFEDIINALPSVQAESDNDTEFWRNRAKEYEKMVGELIADMSRGVKFESVELNENGLIFKKQPEIIHCRNCKWHNGENNQCNAQICASMRGEDFCSRAERREE